MNIKNIVIVCCVAAAVSTGSCRKLTEYNPSGATADAVWNTPEGMLTLVNACYYDQRNFYGKEDAILMSEAGTDIWFNADKASFANQLTRYEGFTSASSGTSRNTFQTLYKGLNLCNAGIERIQNVAYSSATEKAQREGEMRFMRAFYLWHIVEFYGGVNLKLTETTGPVVTAVRSPVADFYKTIMDDLDFAKANLPNSWGAEYSRATKKSALGLQARAALSAAYYFTGAERTAYFTKARDLAKEVIDRRTEFGVALQPNYSDIWLPANNKKMSAPGGEALYTISNSAANLNSNFDNNANRMHLWFLMQYNGKIGGLVQSLEYGNDGQRRLMPTLTLIDYFDEQRDSRFDGTFQTVWIANTNYTWTTADATKYKKDPSVVGKQMRAGIDTAMYVTKQSIPNASEALRPYLVFDRDTTYLASTSRVIYGPNNFLAVKKFAYPNRTAPNAQPGFNDIFVIRLAEMYFIAAEAELQLGNAGPAATYFNFIRTRAAKKTPVDYTAAMQVTAGDITLDFILAERAREFAGEHLRWFDVKRIKSNNNFASFIKATNPDITAVQDFHRLRPVPQEELDALTNGKEFGQNFGY
jgi:starch-binding outer membrane protein, SusD/RagB family